MKKNSFKILFVLLLLFISTKNVEALDINQKASINVVYQYGEEVFANHDVTLYQIADLKEDGTLAYRNEFIDNKDLDNLTASEWSDLAVSLQEEIKEKNIAPLFQLKTNEAGVVNYANLNAGLYLITVENFEQDGYQYKTLPMLISAPNFDEVNQSYVYDMDLRTKTEQKKIEEEIKEPDNNNDNVPTPDEKEDVPYTFDAIIIYVIIAIISFAIIILLVYFIQKSRKEQKNNEEKK